MLELLQPVTGGMIDDDAILVHKSPSDETAAGQDPRAPNKASFTEKPRANNSKPKGHHNVFKMQNGENHSRQMQNQTSETRAWDIISNLMRRTQQCGQQHLVLGKCCFTVIPLQLAATAATDHLGDTGSVSVLGPIRGTTVVTRSCVTLRRLLDDSQILSYVKVDSNPTAPACPCCNFLLFSCRHVHLTSSYLSTRKKQQHLVLGSPQRCHRTVCTDNSRDLSKTCQDLKWTHVTNTLHRSKTNGIATSLGYISSERRCHRTFIDYVSHAKGR